MDFHNIMRNLLCLSVLLIAKLSTPVDCWQSDWIPNYTSRLSESDPSYQVFEGLTTEHDHFKMLMVEGDTALVGAKNRVYNISLVTVKNISTLLWEPDQGSISVCQMREKRQEECQNYIRVLVRIEEDNLFICGTNAYRPMCRNYRQESGGKFVMDRNEEVTGTAICPFDPSHNTTAIYADGKLYSATVADFNAKDPLILEHSKMIRTEQFDSKWLNEPNFVSSYEKDDKIFFFFRETAVENINCGKAVFSRVGRVCKQDQGGGNFLLLHTYTSFFKARLNCSLPGEFPFYFDEIQSTSEFGQGNYQPTSDSGDRFDMIYAVFNTPQNSIHGSAICAFRYSDINSAFQGRFKGQDTFMHNWLPVNWDKTPSPHPGRCANDSATLPYENLNFIKKHPLMDEAVPASGGGPLLVHTSFKSQFTQIAIDWQVHAADSHYYDVMFIGTYDGRIIKAINKATTSKIDPVVIEDMQVLDPDDPVVNLKVFRDKGRAVEKLIVVSRKRVVSIPLHRCEQRTTCSSCIALQDPYCAWTDSQCANAERGLQSIADGHHKDCPSSERVTEATTEKPVDSSECSCPPVKPDRPDKSDEDKGDGGHDQESQEIPDDSSENPRVDVDDSKVLAAKAAGAEGFSTEVLVIAIVVSMVLSVMLGFFIGFMVQSRRLGRGRDNVFLDKPFSSLPRSRNRLSSGDSPFFHTDHTLTPKQVNYVVNVKGGKMNTSAVETKPVTKSNKVYL